MNLDDDYKKLQPVEAIQLLASIKPLAAKLTSGGLYAELTEDERLMLYSFDKLVSAGWTENDNVRRAAGLGRDDISSLGYRAGLERLKFSKNVKAENVDNSIEP